MKFQSSSDTDWGQTLEYVGIVNSAGNLNTGLLAESLSISADLHLEKDLTPSVESHPHVQSSLFSEGTFSVELADGIVDAFIQSSSTLTTEISSNILEFHLSSAENIFPSLQSEPFIQSELNSNGVISTQFELVNSKSESQVKRSVDMPLDLLSSVKSEAELFSAKTVTPVFADESIEVFFNSSQTFTSSMDHTNTRIDLLTTLIKLLSSGQWVNREQACVSVYQNGAWRAVKLKSKQSDGAWR